MKKREKIEEEKPKGGKPCWQWFDELEKAFEREEISEEEYLKNITPIKKAIKIKKEKDIYTKRIVRYMLKHPDATLSEARGHSEKR